MVGRCISYWNSPFVWDMLVFRVVIAGDMLVFRVVIVGDMLVFRVVSVSFPPKMISAEFCGIILDL